MVSPFSRKMSHLLAYRLQSPRLRQRGTELPGAPVRPSNSRFLKSHITHRTQDQSHKSRPRPLFNHPLFLLYSGRCSKMFRIFLSSRRSFEVSDPCPSVAVSGQAINFEFGPAKTGCLESRADSQRVAIDQVPGGLKLNIQNIRSGYVYRENRRII